MDLVDSSKNRHPNLQVAQDRCKEDTYSHAGRDEFLMGHADVPTDKSTCTHMHAQAHPRDERRRHCEGPAAALSRHLGCVLLQLSLSPQ